MPYCTQLAQRNLMKITAVSVEMASTVASIVPGEMRSDSGKREKKKRCDDQIPLSFGISQHEL